MNGIPHNFSTPRTLQQIGVAKQKNRSLEDMARTLISKNNLPKSLWVEAINTTNYVLNRCLIRLIFKKVPYELLKRKKPNISFFKAFRIKCFIHNMGKDNHSKCDTGSEEGIFLSYSLISKAYHIYNKHTNVIDESIISSSMKLTKVILVHLYLMSFS